MAAFKGYKRSIVMDFTYDEVKKGVPEVNRQLTLLETEYKKVNEALGNNADQTEKLILKQDRLTMKLTLQSNKVNILKSELAALENEEQKNEKAIDRKTIALKNAEFQMLKTRNEIERISNELNSQTSVTEKLEGNITSLGKDLELLNISYDKTKLTLDENTQATERLKAEQDYLNEKIKIQKELVEHQTKLLEESKKATGETSNETKAYAIALKNAEVQMLKTGNEIEKIAHELKGQVSVTASLEDHIMSLGKDLELLNVSYDKTKSTLEDHTSAVTKFKLEQTYLNEKLSIQKELVEKQTRLLEESKKETGETSHATKDYAIALAKIEQAYEQTQKEITNLTKELDKQKEVLGKTAEEWEKIGSKTGEVGKALTRNVSAPLAAIGALGVKAAVDFDTAFTGVEKTVNGTSEQLEQLKEAFRKMATEIPASAVEIANVAEVAGQLGIEIENIEEFTRVMIDLGNATNISATEGAQQLAQFANIMRTSQTDFDRVGSTIVQLGNNFATTEADILNMATRLAGAGTQVKMTESQLIAFATALTSVGLEAEAGGTAMSKVMIDMQVAAATGGSALQDFADVAGMSVGRFQQLFEKDAAEAVMAFVSGLGKLEKTGVTAIEVLDAMDIKEVRLRDTLLRASSASDLFAEALKMGNEAWEENVALTKEAETRYASAASLFEMFMNALTEFAMQIGDVILPPLLKFVEFATDLVQAFIAIPEPLRKVIVTVGMLVAALGPILFIISTIANSINGISTAMKTVNDIGTLFSSAAGNSVYLTFVKWSVVIIAVVAAVTALVVAINYLIGRGAEMNSAVSDITNSMSKTQSTLQSQANNTSVRSYAIGTQYHRGGRARVGEYGPEEVILPEGSQVLTADETRNRSKEQTTFNLNGPITIQSNNAEDLFSQIQIKARRGAFG